MLAQEPGHAKALYQRAACFSMRGQWHEAIGGRGQWHVAFCKGERVNGFERKPAKASPTSHDSAYIGQETGRGFKDVDTKILVVLNIMATLSNTHFEEVFDAGWGIWGLEGDRYHTCHNSKCLSLCPYFAGGSGSVCDF